MIFEERVLTYTTSGIFTQEVDAFQRLSIDQRLALLWFIYTEMGESVTPAAPGASTVSPAIAGGLFDQVKALSHDEQLQVQRDLVAGKSSQISREYGAMGDTTKLLFWYLLAQGMDNNTVVPMPSDYRLEMEADSLFSRIKQLDYSEQMTLLRDFVAPMGVDPT